ncbi:MAG: DUF362 domain-containing protein [Spirochaetaceae bacterium]|nr:MAG: DUF362 domain-containing protein [Spirochaetaceae bacterium]
MKSTVCIFNVPGYDVDRIEQTVERGLEILGLGIQESKRILLKPNIISQNYPSQCTTTHPGVVEAVVRVLKKRNAAVVIGESSAFYEKGFTEMGFRTSGIQRVADKYDIPTRAFEKHALALFKEPSNRVLPEILLPADIREYDLIVNLPKLKTHMAMYFSGAVKNLFGLVPGGAKYEYHFLNGMGHLCLAHKMCDIVQTVRPGLHIMDAVWGLEGPGPTAMGRPRHTGLIIMAKDPFALDFAAGSIAGYDPAGIPTNAAAIERGLMPSREDIEIKGDFSSLAELPVFDFKKPVISPEQEKNKNTLYKIMAVSPRLVARRCDSCGICARECAVGAIAMSNKPLFNERACLHCYHCFYSCPHHAIKLSGKWYNRVVQVLRRLIRL